MFKNKVILITGASSAIGTAAAKLFARDGGKLAIVDQNETELNELADQCEMVGTRPLIIKADISIDEEARTIVNKTIDHYKQLDVLINNAAIAKYAGIFDVDLLNVYDEVMNTNVRAVILITNLAVPHIVKTKGNIVNVSSMMGKDIVTARFLPYTISEAALDHFTRELAAQFGMHGVRVNSVKPGPVKVNYPDIESIPEEIRHLPRAQNRSDPEENAGLVFFLACDKAKNITGSSYVVNNTYRLVKL